MIARDSDPTDPIAADQDPRSRWTTEPLLGRVAFVTGAARGIGRAIAVGLAQSGADVAVADVHLHPFEGETYYRLKRRVSGPEEAMSTADSVVALGRRAVSVALDVSDAEAVERAIATCTAKLGPPDILVNNAGIVNNIASIANMQVSAWERELNVNLSGMFHTVRVTAPAMAKRGWGRVINISSVAAITPALGQPAYAASKAGVIAFTRAVAQEFGPGGVTANAILPGLIATPLVQSMPEHIRRYYVERTPVGRLGQPEDLATLASFLATPAAGFVTGAAITCDGGATYAPLQALDTPPPA